MSESVWGIASGEYSDYRVHAVCASKAEAEDIVMRAAAYGGAYDESYFVQEFPLVSGDVERVEILRMQVTIWDDGSTTEERRDLRVEWPFNTIYENDAKPVHWRWVRAPIHRDKGGRLEVAGVDHERVRKVFGDRRAMLLSDDVLRARENDESPS